MACCSAAHDVGHRHPPGAAPPDALLNAVAFKLRPTNTPKAQQARTRSSGIASSALANSPIGRSSASALSRLTIGLTPSQKRLSADSPVLWP